MRNVFLSVALVVSVAFLIAACERQKPSPAPEKTPAVEAPSPAPEAAPEAAPQEAPATEAPSPTQETAPEATPQETMPEGTVAPESGTEGGSSGGPATKGDPAKGKEKFVQICASCHGETGKGDGPAGAALNPKPRDLTDAAYTSSLTDEHLHKVIAEGGAAVGRSPLMPAWKGALTDEDIDNVIAYIRKDVCKCEYRGQ
ncbi:MAG: cytochrome c [Candidatus Methanosuratincola sp.]